MIALIQRVIKSKVKISNEVASEIGKGLLILVGIFEDDSESDLNKLAEKISTLRIMADQENKMNLSISDIKGEILVVSQFTLVADLAYGRRPSFIKAKKPADAEILYNSFVEKLRAKNIPVKTGAFGKYMTIEIVNDGPVTIIADSKNI